MRIALAVWQAGRAVRSGRGILQFPRFLSTTAAKTSKSQRMNRPTRRGPCPPPIGESNHNPTNQYMKERTSPHHQKPGAFRLLSNLPALTFAAGLCGTANLVQAPTHTYAVDERP